jgi:peptide/nickel transport system permease protein
VRWTVDDGGGSVGKYLGRRIFNSCVSIIGLIVLVFFLARLSGNPADLYLPPDAPADVRFAFSQSHGFNDPVIVQFWRYANDLTKFDFGQSLTYQRPALTIVLEAYPTTLKLAAVTIALALMISIIAGALAARRPNGIVDRFASITAVVGAGIPNFWLALVVILIFAVALRWLPTSGTGSLKYWILPVAVLFVRPCGIIVQVVRSAMIDALSSAYVKTARTKGLPHRKIIFIHALRNAMLPVITVTGTQAARIINGAVVVETVFGFPGIGRLMLDSISHRDFAVVQAGVIIVSLAIFLLNVLIDFIYVTLDPRVRYD